MFALVNNRRGIILATSYMMVAALVILGSAFVSRGIAVKNASERGRDLKRSFWAAEAGLQEALWNIRANPTWTTGGSTNIFGEGSYVLVASDGATRKTITCAANVGGIQQSVQVELSFLHPAYDDTIASGGDLDFWGFFSYAYAHGQTRLSGEYDRHGFIAGMGFADKQEDVSRDFTTVTYPDGVTDANTTDGDFEDFVDYYQDAVSSLPADDVVYMTTDSTVNVHPFSFRGKKLVFVEGTAPGTGSVNIWFDAGTWGSDEDLTIVSTGEINYIQPLQSPADEARLSTVSWGDFSEGNIIISYHRSAIHTQSTANFLYALGVSAMEGTVIANQGILVASAVSLKAFRYSSQLGDGNIPPGFEMPVTQYNSVGDPVDWQQL